MTRMAMLGGCTWLWLLVAAAGGYAATFRVPLMTEPPRIDGRIDAAEWADGLSVDGFGAGGVCGAPPWRR